MRWTAGHVRRHDMIDSERIDGVNDPGRDGRGKTVDEHRNTTFAGMFDGVSGFAQDLSKWETEEATDMSRMFSGTCGLQADAPIQCCHF